MKYCKKCGAELEERVSFCEKCGNPVGQVPKHKNVKRKWVIVISFGVILLAVAIVGGLFATGVIGGKNDVVQTSIDTADIQETTSVTGEAVADTEELGRDKQKDTSDNENIEDMALEAFRAYKSCIDEQKKVYNEEYEEENRDSEDYEYDHDYYNDAHKFVLAYVDDDEYPEMIVEEGAILRIYTYKTETVVEAVSVECAGFGGLSSYLEKSGYMYVIDSGSDWHEETMFKLEGTEVKEIYSNLSTKDINTGQYMEELLGENKILEQKGVAGGTWIQTTDYEEDSMKWYTLWRETVDEAYTQFLMQKQK